MSEAERDLNEDDGEVPEMMAHRGDASEVFKL